MTAGRDYSHDMPRNPLDDATVDRLLSGHLAPEDAPAGFGHLASLVTSATGPAAAGELARETAVVRAASAAAVAAAAGMSALPTTTRGRSMLSKFLTAKFAAAATAAAFGVGTAAAAASGVLPGQHPSHSQGDVATVSSTTSSSSPTTTPSPTTIPSSTTRPTTTGGMSGTTTASSLPTTGPGNANAQFGLCTAFLAHHPSGTTSGPGKSDEAPPFKALISQNGGMAGTYTYCQGLVSTATTAAPSTATTEATDAPEHSTPEPTDAAEPADTGDSSTHTTTTSGSAGSDHAGTASTAGSAAGTHGH